MAKDFSKANLQQLAKFAAIRPAVIGALRQSSTKKELKKHLLPRIDDIYTRAQFIRFMSGGRDRGVGGAWVPLAPWYEKAKLARHGPLPILTLTGRMAASFINSGHGMHIARVLKGLIQVGSRHPKAAQHEFGQGVPVRRLSGASEETQQEFFTEVKKYFGDFMMGRVLSNLRKLNSKNTATPSQQGVSKERLMKRLGEFG